MEGFHESEVTLARIEHIRALREAKIDDGLLEEAERLMEDSLAIHRETGNRHYEGLTLCDMAALLVRRRRAEDARKTWQSGVELMKSLGENVSLEVSRVNMIEACREAGVPPLDEDPA